VTPILIVHSPVKPVVKKSKGTVRRRRKIVEETNSDDDLEKVATSGGEEEDEPENESDGTGRRKISYYLYITLGH